jgi:hypothetical protein
MSMQPRPLGNAMQRDADTSRQQGARAQVSPHQRHERMVRGTAPKPTTAEAARVDVASTDKLKGVAVELRDPIVLDGFGLTPRSGGTGRRKPCGGN